MLLAQIQSVQSESAAHSAFTIGLLISSVMTLVIILIPAIFYLLTLQKALNRCSPENRTMAPGMVWLMFIPFFNLVWGFVMVINVARSLAAEFQKRSLACESEPGKPIGLAMCILICCGWIPFLGALTTLAALVCWIIYWVKIAGYSKQLAA